ncbi:hypothetical protein MKK69_21800 [Methylobacterium sp. J-026]|uniref:hypothetical protein n=1 Tax=Methylobacterium sp. J-026 TaxID=2836624 RepID=UPI001FB99EC1|nr:hypothetical protein [Methylobacterium sp. J-026]MCJ2136648.1 hypothetical protein [Methylobacterium sp. J-026]
MNAAPSCTRTLVSEQSVQGVSGDSLEAAADALLRIVVTGERERSAVANPDWAPRRPWTDTLAPPSTDDLNVAGLAADPIGAACRAELRRIGHALRAANPHEDFVALEVEIAEMDPTHAGWRAMVLEMAWHGIGGPTP